MYKGSEYQGHAELYNCLQRTIKDQKMNFMEWVKDVKNQLEDLEKQVIYRTKSSVSLEDQANGKLVHRLPTDAKMINDSSMQYFTIIYDICRQINLNMMIPVISTASIHTKKHEIATGKIIPGNASIPISKQLDEVLKQAKSLHQYMQITLDSICKLQRSHTKNHRRKLLERKVAKAIHGLLNQSGSLIESLDKTIAICKEVSEERKNHIH